MELINEEKDLLIIEDEPVSPVGQELILTNKDFPSNYVNFAHPEDYLLTSSPIPVEYLFHEHYGRHSRLILRCSLQLSSSTFISLSFVLDTGAPKFYASEHLSDILFSKQIATSDLDLGMNYITLFGRKFPLEQTPTGHHPANIIGLKMLCRWGLILTEEPFGFHFTKNFPYLKREE
jgi:U3 small nucleolar RNA-associated protein 25